MTAVRIIWFALLFSWCASFLMLGLVSRITGHDTADDANAIETVLLYVICISSLAWLFLTLALGMYSLLKE